MRRIDKERDRLLRRLARAGSLTGAIIALACLVVPGALDADRFSLVVALDLLVIVLAVVATSRGALLPTLATILAAVALLLAIGLDPVVDPAAATAMAVTAALTTPAIAIPMIVRPSGPALMIGSATGVLGAIGISATTGADMGLVLVAALAGWIACTATGVWLARAIQRAADRIDEVGRAHEAERLASESEAQQRQDARVLHDTVLATLSLLAHSGVGVGASALRQQAGDDARLLKQLRLGAPLDNGSSVIFSPESTAGAGGLGTTFESVRKRFARMGLDVNWHGAGQLVLPRDTLDALLGALGECLENVRRHSGVHEADVTITDDERTVRAMVTDQGAGFEPTSVDPARLGFAESVVGRLHAVGGRARVFSSPGSGTTVMLEVPKP
ncbi:sensor histidine kinase [Agromyces aurantiacus]|uniref:Sensor histidine kinase n=1 Tax=Agromyces aurantiacus TaxID=165814 RepID=A0ABV9RB46_9MICO|nr:ATP-binding protein [Agromyces aurantiacus]MBM7504249.1 signal transduction histidine kinase [Agromyces aurantiacus]